MTPAEFKSWFEGFTEAFTGCPTKAQWARIKDRVGEIDGKAVTERVYVDRYINRYWGPGPAYPYWQQLGSSVCYAASSGRATTLANVGSSHAQNALGFYQNADNSFNGLTAMNALGRAEAASLAA
jgi:hypothetical protein